MRIVFDIDGTICTHEDDYRMAKPIQEVIDRVNAHHSAGDYVILQTARGTLTGVDWEEVTRLQLQAWGVKYDELCFGKAAGDVYVDDKAYNVDDWETGIERLSAVQKIWGTEYLLVVTDRYVMKRLVIDPGCNISYQYHERKHETWHIVSGDGLAVFDDAAPVRVKAGDTFIIEPGRKHQIKAGKRGVTIVEASTPELDDIVRLNRRFVDVHS